MKNKFILGLILGIFLVGLVSAGITGYVIRGQSLSSDGVTATLQSVDRFGTATVVVKTPTGTESVQITEGRTATTSEGTTITASNLRTGSLFSRAGGNLQIARGPQFAGIATGTGNQTNQTGNTSCMMCTKKYQVLEGEAIVVDGNTFSINYMDSDSSVLSVNQGLTSDLLVGQTFIVNGEIVTLTDVNHPVGPGVGDVEFCFSGCHQILEGEAIVVDGNTFSINYMDSDSSVLSVNQGLTSDLLVGQTFIVNGQIVTLTEINPPVGLGVGNVQFCQSSSY